MVACRTLRATAAFGAVCGLRSSLMEAGGTSVIYLTHQPLDELGFKQVTKRPLPSYTWQALRLVPGIFLTVGGGLSLVSWFNHRKERIKNEEAFKNSRVKPETLEQDTKEEVQ